MVIPRPTWVTSGNPLKHYKYDLYCGQKKFHCNYCYVLKCQNLLWQICYVCIDKLLLHVLVEADGLLLSPTLMKLRTCEIILEKSGVGLRSSCCRWDGALVHSHVLHYQLSNSKQNVPERKLEKHKLGSLSQRETQVSYVDRICFLIVMSFTSKIPRPILTWHGSYNCTPMFSYTVIFNTPCLGYYGMASGSCQILS